MHKGYQKTLFIANGLFVFASNLLVPIFAIFVNKFENSIVFVSLSYALFLSSNAIFLVILAKLGDRVQKKENLIAAGYIIRAIIWMGYAMSTDIYQILFLQILLGLGEAIASPAFDSYMAEHLEAGHHIKNYSSWKLIQALAAAAASLLGAFIVQQYGFSLLFYLMSALSIVSTLTILFMTSRLSVKIK